MDVHNDIDSDSARASDCDSKRMQAVYETRIAPIVKLREVKPGYGISGIKVALEALGRAGGPVRPPYIQVQKEDRETIAAIAREHAEKLP